MAVSLPDGTVYSIATTMGSAISMTDLANGKDPAATLSGGTVNANDIVVIGSGWSKINDRVAKIGATDKLLGIDTTDTDQYPAGSGGGSLSVASDFVQISQVLSSESSGGEQQFTTYSFLENDFENQIPTRSSPSTITLSLADDPTLQGYQALEKAAESRKAHVIKARFPSGSEIFYNAYVSLNQTPSMTKGEVMAVTATISITSRATRYAS
ncbi:tail protein [Vibrio phage Marilyn]|nr:tail protein [Vibrio phage Marilyn]WCD55530.1 tail protein [Vibrio phage Fayden]WCD55587.1 tail protein [Vibrio phage Baybae]WCD55646.1 tail protein [Vibrio phage Vaitephage]